MNRCNRTLILCMWSYCSRFVGTTFLGFGHQIGIGSTGFYCVFLHNFSGGLLEALVHATNSKSLSFGMQIHCHTIKSGLRSDVFYQNNLIKLYLNSGKFESGMKVFDHMPERNLVSWTLIVSSAIQNDEPELGIRLFQVMRRPDVLPDEFALNSVLNGCVFLGARTLAFCCQCLALKIGIDGNQFVGCSMLHMYAKFGLIGEAEKVFRNISGRDIGTWNAMIGGYSECDRGFEAVNLLCLMLVDGLVPDSVTFINSLKGCLMLGCIHVAKRIHGLLIKSKKRLNHSVMNYLMDVYFNLDATHYGLNVFSSIPDKDIVSWNTLFSSFSKIQISSFVQEFLASNSRPNCITFALLFKYCGMMQDIYLGFQVYSLAMRAGVPYEASVVSSAIYMFSRFGTTTMACQVFDIASLDNQVVWNEMISGYHFNCFCEEALVMFKYFLGLGLEGNESSYSIILDVCGCSGNRNMAAQIHCSAVKIGFISNKYVLSSALRCYARCRLLDDSFQFFNEHDLLDLAVWGTMFSELMHGGRSNEITRLLNCLLGVGGKPDEIILACVFGGYAVAAAYFCARSSHALVVKFGFIVHVFVASSVINAYAKCGDVESARMVFQQSSSSDDVVLFNTIIMAYAHHGLVNEALEIFDDVKSGKLQPTQATFVSVIYACNHFGFVDLGRSIFKSMMLMFNLQPSRDVYGCLVDMLSRHGFLEEAKEIIQNLPFSAWPAVWRSFLNGCRMHHRPDLAEWAAYNLIFLMPENDAAYILLSRIYSDCGNCEDAAMMGNTMITRGVRKTTSFSYIET